MKRKIFILSLFFIFWTILVYYNLTTKFDQYIYALVTRNMNDNLTIFYKYITNLGSTWFITILTLLIIVILKIFKKHNTCYLVGASVIISTVFNRIIKIIIKRTRPNINRLIIQHGYSYPSGHTMATVSLYGVLLYLLIKSNLNIKIKLIGCLLLSIIIILIPLSRIYLGVHYPSDIIGGFILSYIILLSLIKLFTYKKFNKQL